MDRLKVVIAILLLAALIGMLFESAYTSGLLSSQNLRSSGPSVLAFAGLVILLALVGIYAYRNEKPGKMGKRAREEGRGPW